MIETRELGKSITSRIPAGDWTFLTIVCLFALFFLILITFSRADAQLHLPWLMADNSYYYSILLTSQGERPYVDFQPRYTPGLFYLNAAIFNLLGVRMSFVRWGIAIFWLLDFLGLYLVARFFMPRKFAVLPPSLALMWGPLDRWVPWASWYSIPLAIFSLYFMLRYIKNGSTREFLFAVFFAGVSFFFKQSTGAYTMIFLLVAFGCFGGRKHTAEDNRGACAREAKTILALRMLCIAFGCFLFPLMLMRNDIVVRHVMLHLVPITSLGIFLIAFVLRNRREEHEAARKGRGILSFCAPLALAGIVFFGVTLLWFPVASEGIGFLGLTKYLLMLRRPEFISAGSELNLTPELSAATFTPTVFYLSILLMGWILFSRIKKSIRVAAVAAILFIEIAALFLFPSLAAHMKSEVLHTSAWMVLAFHVVMLGYLCVKTLHRKESEGASANYSFLVVLLIFCNFFFLQLFPLNSPSHVLWATNAWFVPAAWLAYMFFQRLPATDSAGKRATFRKGFRYAFAVVPLLLYFCVSPLFNLSIQFATFGYIVRRDNIAPPPVPTSSPGIDEPRGKFELVFRPNKLARPNLERVDILLRAEFAYGLNAVIGYIRERTSPNEYVFGPNLNFLNFAAGRPSPLSENYFFPGWVSRREEAEMLREIDLLKPKYVVFYASADSNDLMSYNRFRSFFPLFARYLESGYVVEKEIGPFAIARRL